MAREPFLARRRTCSGPLQYNLGMLDRLIRLTAAACAALCVLSGAPAPSPASAAPAVRVVPVVGTGHHLVYGKYSPVKTGKTTVRLYSLDDRGRTRTLGSIKTFTPSAIPATAAGSVLVAPRNGVENFRWDLTTGARSTIEEQTVAAPGGYAAPGSNGAAGADSRQAVILVTDQGRTDIGVPFPDGENVDGGFHLASGSAGVTITDGNGHIRFIAFAAPGTVRALHTYGGGASSASLRCPSSTSTMVACAGFDEETTTLMGIRLDGTGVISAAPDCVSAPAALRTAIAWLGCRNRLEVLHADGSLTRSRTLFGSARPVSAFGEVVLQSRSGTSLQTMTRSGSKPRTIVRSAG